MAQASAAIDIPASPTEVWQLIGGFNSLPDWLGNIPKSELSEGGRVRHLANPKGETIVERLEKFDKIIIFGGRTSGSAKRRRGWCDRSQCGHRRTRYRSG